MPNNHTGNPDSESDLDAANVPAPADRSGDKLLRWAVYIMGVLLVLGTIVVVVTIAKRASQLPSKPKAQFDLLDVPVAAGSAVSRVDLDGDRMAVHVKDGPGAGEILIIDVKRGTLLGRVRLQSAQ